MNSKGDLEISRPPDLLLLTVSLQKQVYGCPCLVYNTFACLWTTSKNILGLAKSIYWPF